MSEIAKNTLEGTRMRRQQGGSGKYHWIFTGISTLDRVSSGLKKGELVCIAARPAMGKTSLASCIAAHLALKENKSVFIYSGEMYVEYYLYRIISAYAEIPALSFRDGELDTAGMDLFEKTIEEIACSKLHIADTPAIRVSKLREKCEKIKNADGFDLLIVGYFQLLSPEREYGTMEEQVEEQVWNLKQLALSMDIPVIILSQLSRNLEWRADHRPMLGDFMEDSVVNISDKVWFLYRDAYYNKVDPDNDIMEVIVTKQYMVVTSYQILSWDQECCRCSDYRFSTTSNGVTWKDIVSRFLYRMLELTETDAAGIDVEDAF